MRILPICRQNNFNNFRAQNSKQQKRQEILNDLSDGCITLGLLCSDFSLTNTTKKTKRQSFGQVLLVLGAAIVAWRFTSRMFDDSTETKK